MRKEFRRSWKRLYRLSIRGWKPVICGMLCVILGIYIFISIKNTGVEAESEKIQKAETKVSEDSGDTVETQGPENPGEGEIEEKAEKAMEETKEDSGQLQEILPEAEDNLLTEKEKEQLQELALEAAGRVRDVYRNLEIREGPSFASNIEEFTPQQCKEVVSALGKAGYISVTEGCNMEHPEMVEAFYEAYQKEQEALFTVFDVNVDGLISMKTLIYRKNRLQIYYIGIGWLKGGIPEIRDTSVSDLKEINLTEKGYFIYQYKNIMPHSSLRLYWRVKPLSDKCRELTEKYVSGVSYVNYNMLVTNWDSSNVEDILMPCMFEDIYRIYTGENIRPENGMIPAVLYEKIMTTCFPVSAKQLRSCCGYDRNSDAYPYEMILGHQYPPFGEVVDYKENTDGTITLTVDGVWPDYNSDCAFVNTIVVRPWKDGTFCYLSNVIEERELELPGASEVKDYDLPISEAEREEAEKDCVRMMALVFDVYKQTDNKDASDVVLSEEMLCQMQDQVKDAGSPVVTAALYSDMENYRKADRFLRECQKGKSGSMTIYKIRFDGGIGRSKFIFDGRKMYVLTANAVWGAEQRPRISYISFAGIKEWDYTDNGWFGYKMCVPEYPEVTEIVDGSCLIRIRPMSKRQKELSEQCVRGLGYCGNNLLCSDWDADHMDQLDYNGVYEYLYGMKYQKEFPYEDYRNGIPAEAFENLIMEYLPITAKQLREYAIFDEKTQTYAWIQLRGGNYILNFFETSLPEVRDIAENEDGTVTLTVNAVCDTVICDDAVITHELTVKFGEDGRFWYLGNRILGNGAQRIPEYQYRVPSFSSVEG